MLNTQDIYNDDGALPRLLTALEVSDILNIGHSTVYQLLRRKEIPCVRIGRSVRVRIDDVENYIASKRTMIEG